MAGFWSQYFRSESTLSAVREGVTLDGVAAAQIALSDSLSWLQNNRRRVVLIGPVPVYDKNVPLSLAVGIATQQQLLHSTLADQMHKSSAFFEVVDAAGTSPNLTFLNPLQWLCDSHDCLLIKNGQLLYRDGDHLSVPGALAFANLLAQGLALPVPQSTSDPKELSRAVQ